MWLCQSTRLSACRFSEQYFRQILSLFDEAFRPERRRTFKAYDGLNNLLNLAYWILSWKVHLSLIRSKLEPYLGFLHSVQWGTPSLVCDFQELYRYLIDDFVIDFCNGVKVKDFILKNETYAGNKFGKRQYVNEPRNREFLNRLNRYLETKAYFTKRGLTKRTVPHELYHHLIYVNHLEIPGRKEDALIVTRKHF